MSDQTIRIKYVGTVQRWPELSVTGRQSAWMPGQIESRAPSEATALLATGLFSSPPVPVTAVTSPGGGMRIGGRELAYKGNSRWRKALDSVSQEGVLVTDFGFGGPAVTVTKSAGAQARYDVVTLPDGTRQTALFLTVGLNQTLTVDIAIEPRNVAPTGCVGVRAFLPDGTTGVDMRVYLTNTAMSTYRRGNLTPDVGALSSTGFVDARYPVSTMTNTGAVAADAVFDQLRVEFINTSLRGFGEVILLGVTIDRKEVPRFIFTADDGAATDIWYAQELAKYGMKLTSYIITDESKAPVDYTALMTWEQKAQLAGMPNVQLGSHTHSHACANGLKDIDHNGARSQALSLAAIPADGAVVLNGSIGSAAFDMPRCVTIRCGSTTRGWDATIVGEYQGKTVTEKIIGASSDNYPRSTNAIFDKVTSITCAMNGITPAGTVQYGVSCSYAEAYYELSKSFSELESRGLITERHYCHPYGVTNTIMDQVLSDLGVRTARGTSQSVTGLENISDFFNINAIQWDSTTYEAKMKQVNWAMGGGNTIVVYCHELPEGSSKRAVMAQIIETIGALVQSGAAKSLTMAELWAESVT